MYLSTIKAIFEHDLEKIGSAVYKHSANLRGSGFKYEIGHHDSCSVFIPIYIWYKNIHKNEIAGIKEQKKVNDTGLS